ncbi:MAG TPA: ShlB/FhaC/HecB family hemolysin secretion/activation protein [Negativicutes bacterium]|nr:ShlB/FhaC/HecB family hemolysin secretion/activation protein [Negativicutes bacterium]
MKNSILHHGKNTITLGMLLTMLATLPAYAAAPTTGAVLEGAKPPAVTQQPAAKGPVVTVEGQTPAAKDDGQQKIAVKGFRIGGEPPMPPDDLLGLVRDDAGRDLTLGGLDAAAARITEHLRQKGFLVAFAYIPAQDIVDGMVEIAVVPGKYGKLKITGDGRFDRERLKAMLFAVAPGTVITARPLERALLLLSDLNGVSVKATLSPGEASGTADLLVEVSDAARWKGSAFIDNWGSRFTSRNRLGLQLTAGNIGGRGDELTLGGLISENSLITNYNLGYSALLGNDGLRVSASRSQVDYTLGDAFAALGATGQATVTSVALAYPLVRSQDFSLYGTLGYDAKRLADKLTTTKKSSLISLGVAGNFADGWLGGGTNAFSLTNCQGRLRIRDAAWAAVDAWGAGTAGSFSKTLLSFQRQQYVSDQLTLHLNFTGQLADKNLDSSEKFFLGGADGVRAFPPGEASGDDGYRLTGELRWRLPGLSAGKNDLYLVGFYDYGSVILNHHRYAAADSNNRRSLMGAGLGLLWTHNPDWALRLDYAWKIGREQATADEDRNGRLWLQAMRYF